MDFDVILDRATRALKSDATAFSEAGQDEAHTSSAAVLVAAIGLIGGIISGVFGGDVGTSLLGGVVGAFIAWFIGTGIMYLLAKLFGGEGDYMALLRGNAYAATPNVIGGIPFIGILGLYAVWLYILNVRENMSLSTGAAAAVVLIPAAILLFLAIILVVLVGIALFGAAS